MKKFLFFILAIFALIPFVFADGPLYPGAIALEMLFAILIILFIAIINLPFVLFPLIIIESVAYFFMRVKSPDTAKKIKKVGVITMICFLISLAVLGITFAVPIYSSGELSAGFGIFKLTLIGPVIQNLAHAPQSIADCQKNVSWIPQDQCYRNLGILKGDQNICLLISDSLERCNCISRAACNVGGNAACRIAMNTKDCGDLEYACDYDCPAVK